MFSGGPRGGGPRGPGPPLLDPGGPRPDYSVAGLVWLLAGDCTYRTQRTSFATKYSHSVPKLPSHRPYSLSLLDTRNLVLLSGLIGHHRKMIWVQAQPAQSPSRCYSCRILLTSEMLPVRNNYEEIIMCCSTLYGPF